MKILKIILVFCLLLFPFLTQCQVSQSLSYNNLNFDVFKILNDSNSIKNLGIVFNPGELSFQEFIDERTINYSDDYFLTNACIIDNDGLPLGLLVNDYQEITPLNLGSGSGNFYLKPNGVLDLSNKKASINSSDRFVSTNKCRNAIQSGPMLILNDTINSNFNINSTNRNVRSGVGVCTQNNINYIVFAVSTNAVTFYEFADFFKNKLGCSNALCLESGNSVMYYRNRIISNDEKNKITGPLILFSKTAKVKRVIKMEKSVSGIYEIPVLLNGVLKMSFIYDSGASDISISPDVALTLIRTGTIKKDDFIGTQTYQFADGSTAESQVFIMREINIGGYVLKNVVASISNSVNAPMLLGQTVMQRIGKLTVDNNSHSLIIE
jgi:uncharacterized protein YigE (DUF2233 family)